MILIIVTNAKHEDYLIGPFFTGPNCYRPFILPALFITDFGSIGKIRAGKIRADKVVTFTAAAFTFRSEIGYRSVT